jgi:hypothetical protein
MIAAIDFETYYDEEYGITTHGTCGYIEDPRFDPYLVSIVGIDRDGRSIAYAGHPDDAPWHLVEGLTWVSHNYSFDGYIWFWMSKTRDWGSGPNDWFCTADLAVYMSAPRSLTKAVKALLPEVEGHGKSLRTWAKGKDAKTIKAHGYWGRMREYALADAWESLQLWTRYADDWPVDERRLSQLTSHCGWKGVHIALDEVTAAIDVLEDQLLNHLSDIPWSGEEPPTSEYAMRQFCVGLGIPAPASTSKEDPSVALWLAAFGEEHKFVHAMIEYRRVNTMFLLLTKIKGMTRADGSMPYDLKYWGAHTGRWSGGSDEMETGKARSFNIQNIYSQELFGIKVRSFFRPRPGMKMIISDLSQIEPRCLAHMIGDWEFLKLVAQGMSPYEAHARLTMGYQDPRPLKAVDPQMYKLAKARVLALGYGCGAEKFVLMAKNYGIEVTPEESKRIVAAFRASNPKLVLFWKLLDRLLKDSAWKAKRGEAPIASVKLPSARFLHYLNPQYRAYTEVQADGSQLTRKQLVAAVEIGGAFYRQYGGKVCENVTQAAARDVFAVCLVRIQNQLEGAVHNTSWACRLEAFMEAQARILFSVHDEVVMEAPVEDADELCSTVEQTMGYPISWLPGCPLAAEAEVANHYKK